MQVTTRVNNSVACRQPHQIIARTVGELQRATVVAFGIGQKQGKRKIGTHVVYERLIGMPAIAHTGVKAGDHCASKAYRQRGTGEHSVAF